MNELNARAGGRAGFTLVEVLIAMVLLAIGLLVLQNLGIGAVKSLAQAKRNTHAATTATLYIEDALQQVRQGRGPLGCTDRVLPDGTVITRVVTVEALPSGTAGSAAGSHVDVEVSVSLPHSTRPPYVTSASAYSPINPLSVGRDCP